MGDWFTVEQIDPETYSISEYRHWEETHGYLLMGTERGLLIDTGLGICDISQPVKALTHLPVTAAATHVHWDHIGGHGRFPAFYAHRAELDWLQGSFPLSIETVRAMVLDRCDPPEEFEIQAYQLFQGTPDRLLEDGDWIDLGGRRIQALHTPGHSPGHLCFWEPERGYLFTGDLIYQDILFAWFPSTDPEAYLASLEKVAALPAKRIFPGHHSLEVEPELPAKMRDQFRMLKAEGKLRHGAGTFQYGKWGVQL